MERTSASLPVVLLTRTGCGLCEQTATVLARLAEDYPLAVSALDFDTAAGQALAQQTGILYVPGIVIDETFAIEGRISEKRLRREIERRLGPVPARRTIGQRAAEPRSGRGVRWRSIFGWVTRDW
jgi:thiol-disulfide isomerase/thioredoxin